LERFLSTHHDLAWILQLGERRWLAGGLTLSDLASAEQFSLSRQKTQLSLAKLSLLAAEQSGNNTAAQHLPRVQQQLNVVRYQELLLKFLPELVCDIGFFAVYTIQS